MKTKNALGAIACVYQSLAGFAIVYISPWTSINHQKEKHKIVIFSKSPHATYLVLTLRE